jgi:acetyltransferase-like isoleucine patch superfamily enzyme
MGKEIKITTRYSMHDEIFEEFGKVVQKVRKLCFKFNQTEPYTEESRAILDELFDGKLPTTTTIEIGLWIDMPDKCKIGENVIIGTDFKCHAMGGIIIEDSAMIADQVSLLTVNHDLNDKQLLLCSPIHIKGNAWIGAKAIVLQGITIGKNAVVAAGAVVTKDVPDNTVVGGNPAKILKQTPPESCRIISLISDN